MVEEQEKQATLNLDVIPSRETRRRRGLLKEGEVNHEQDNRNMRNTESAFRGCQADETVGYWRDYRHDRITCGARALRTASQQTG